ncbi:MAG: hypothetical protein JWR50_358 [Mucilaginibacter sp.]|nr:hypothetical protein [Mucilaginibacter sp.]
MPLRKLWGVFCLYILLNENVTNFIGYNMFMVSYYECIIMTKKYLQDHEN